MKIEERVIHSIISTEICLHHLNELTHTEFYMQGVKNKGNLFLKEVVKLERLYDELDGVLPAQITQVSNVFQDFVETVSKCYIHEMSELGCIVDAYRKSPKQILGIANKILNDK